MVRVGPVTEESFEALLPLVAGYQRFYGVERPDADRNRAFFRRFVAPSDHGHLLGAWDGDDLIGFACLYWTFTSIHAAEIVLLADLFVRVDRRGSGVGRRLIGETVAIARQRGARHVEWLTALDNVTAQRLYDSTGAQRSAWYGYEILTSDGG